MTSIIKVDNIQDVCGSATISKCGTTITIGASGDTVTLAAGASQSGFGRSGTVNWDTTPKTTTFTAVSGNGYFVNTTSGAITVNLPAGVAGAIVAVSDYANTAATNKITIDPNGTDKINGVNENAEITTNGAAITLVYVDSTRGWKDIGDATLDLTGIPPFIAATGGTVTTCGNYKIHTFTGPGTFTVTNAGSPTGSNSVEYLVVAGGAGGGAGSSFGGGGGAGGFRQNYPSPSTAGLPVTATAYPITVGAGGTSVGPGSPLKQGNPGNNSIFSTITSAGGGGGGAWSTTPGLAGGSGGGASTPNGAGAAGNTPPVSPPQGNPGGSANTGPANGGGGGAGAAGGTAGGGNGVATSITGSPVTYAGGGGGGSAEPGPAPVAASGGTGGGGSGGIPSANGNPGTVNTGGGGGGNGGTPTSSGSGGSGIVVIRYKFQ